MPGSKCPSAFTSFYPHRADDEGACLEPAALLPASHVHPLWPDGLGLTCLLLPPAGSLLSTTMADWFAASSDILTAAQTLPGLPSPLGLPPLSSSQTS